MNNLLSIFNLNFNLHKSLPSLARLTCLSGVALSKPAYALWSLIALTLARLTCRPAEALRPGCLMQASLLNASRSCTLAFARLTQVTLAFDQLLPLISQEQRSRAKVVMNQPRAKVKARPVETGAEVKGIGGGKKVA